MGKKYAAAEAQVTEELYAPLEAMALVKDIAFANFDETVDVDIRLNLDTRQADQQLRGTVSLPNGSVRRFALRSSLRATLLVQQKKLAQISLAPMT